MKNVLIVDDEKDIRDLYHEFLTHNLGPINMTVSEDGIEAFMRCTVEKFDLITLDHSMPRLNGLELLVALRNKAGPNQQTPVFVISGHIPETISGQHTFENTYFLKKPLDLELLREYLKMSLLLN